MSPWKMGKKKNTKTLSQFRENLLEYSHKHCSSPTPAPSIPDKASCGSTMSRLLKLTKRLWGSKTTWYFPYCKTVMEGCQLWIRQRYLNRNNRKSLEISFLKYWSLSKSPRHILFYQEMKKEIRIANVNQVIHQLSINWESIWQTQWQI